MNILFVMDPVEKLDPEWDTSLVLAREFIRRGHSVWAADVPNVYAQKAKLFCHATRLVHGGPPNRYSGLQNRKKALRPVESFGLVLIRKDPPFDEAYLGLTHLLEFAGAKVPVVNQPEGIRNANEKLAILNFPEWIPETLVSASAGEILRFQKRIGAQAVVKPLDDKGGKGIFLLPSKGAARKLKLVTGRGKRFVMVQRRLRGIEKRILLLNGKFLSAFEKRPVGKEFRGNLSLGGTFHDTRLTAREKNLLRVLRPYLVREGLYFAGIDVLGEKLIEINVTSPAGVVEAKALRPESQPEVSWAGFLEGLARNFHRR